MKPTLTIDAFSYTGFALASPRHDPPAGLMAGGADSGGRARAQEREAAKVREQKIFVAVAGVALVGLVGFQLPGLLGSVLGLGLAFHRLDGGSGRTAHARGCGRGARFGLAGPPLDRAARVQGPVPSPGLCPERWIRFDERRGEPEWADRAPDALRERGHLPPPDHPAGGLPVDTVDRGVTRRHGRRRPG